MTYFATHSLRKRPARRTRRSQAGFTLLEMMAALVAGLIAIGSIYTLSSASSKHFHEQQRISQTQMSLRMAMARLTADIARAGFGGTPNSQAELNHGMLACNQAPVNPLAAVGFTNHLDGGAAVPNAATNGVQTDRLDLMGNYATSDVYRAMPTPAANQLAIQSNWHSFARSFGIPGDPVRPYNQDAFEDVFRAGRLIHVRTTDQKHFYARVVASNGAVNSFSVTFTPAFNCSNARLDGAMVSPVNRIRYRIASTTGGPLSDMTGLNLANVPTGNVAAGTLNSMLIREELDEAGVRVPNSEQIVLEYAVHADYQFVVDTQLAPGNPPIMQLEQGNPTPNVTNDPHRIRSVIATLGARTPQHDASFGGGASGVTPVPPQPLRTFRVSNTLPGLARVRTLRSEVMLRNMREMRP